MTLYQSGQSSAGPVTPRQPPVRRQRRSFGRLVLVTGLFALLANVLLAEAYTHPGFGPDSLGDQDDADKAVPVAVHEGGPVIDTSGGRTQSFRLPARTIALTFDDGPDPRWTPQVLAVLRRYHVHATFFLVGSQVSKYPKLARQLVADGNEIGSHTFTHPQLATLPKWRRDLEYAQTQSAIGYATGVSTSLLRPPYSSLPDAVDDQSWSTMRSAGRQGYLTVLNDADSRDWARPGVPAIVRNATPPGDAGAIVLMHDAGGDRSETVAALDRFIPAMQQRGYEFTTVSEGIGQSVAAANPPAPSGVRWRGGALVWSIQLADGTWHILWALLLAVGALTLIRTLFVFIVAVRHARRRNQGAWSWGSPVTEPVSIIVPAFNESKTIAAAVRSLALSAHPGVEVIVVDDGSTDGTADAVEAVGLGNIRVVRVPNGGKATALNVGVALARHDLLVMVDADTVVDTDSIHRLVQPFADPAVGAIAGNVKVGNRRGLVGRWQHIEYVIGFNLDRRLYDTLDCIPTIPGALGAFRRQAVADAGGVSIQTIAEDTDLTMAIHRAGWRVVFEPSAVAHTEAPATLRQLWKQRYRWSYGTMQAMWKHRRSVVESGSSGRFGRRGLPMIALFTVFLPLFAPLLDVMAVYGMLFLDQWQTVLGWVVMLIVHVITAVLAFRLDRERLRPLWTLPLQQLLYRQIMYILLIESTLSALSGRRLGWQKLSRTGEVAVAATQRA